MRKIQYSGILLLFFIVSCASQRMAANESKTVPITIKKEASITTESLFALGSGDEIEINVWRHSDLSRTVRVDPSGMIYLPLVGEIEVSGLTIPQLREGIILKLSKYLVDPQVDINAATIKSMKIYVIGEVNAPGTYILDRRMRAMEAISSAGGFSRDANTRNVLLMRAEKDVTRVSALNLNISDIQSGKNPTPVTYLQNGDVIYVVPTVIANVERFMVKLANMLRPFTQLPSAIVLGKDAWDVLSGQKTGKAVGVAVQ